LQRLGEFSGDYHYYISRFLSPELLTQKALLDSFFFYINITSDFKLLESRSGYLCYQPQLWAKDCCS